MVGPSAEPGYILDVFNLQVAVCKQHRLTGWRGRDSSYNYVGMLVSIRFLKLFGESWGVCLWGVISDGW